MRKAFFNHGLHGFHGFDPPNRFTQEGTEDMELPFRAFSALSAPPVKLPWDGFASVESV
jgi:hypothetical protein